VKIEVETKYAVKKPAGPLDVTLKVNGIEVAKGTVPVSAPLLFTANDCLDIVQTSARPCRSIITTRRRSRFTGKIGQVRVKYLGSPAEVAQEKRQTDGLIPAED